MRKILLPICVIFILMVIGCKKDSNPVTGANPNVPVLTAPADGATDQSNTPTLTWNAVTGAVSYHLQVSASNTFAAMIVDDSTITGTTRQLIGLTNNTLYYCRVSATNNAGTSSYSSTRKFTTMSATPVPAGMVLVKSGTFTMGNISGDSDEQPTHSVTLSSFYISKTEVTQGQWKAVMGSNPSHFKGLGDNGPVESVSWYDCISYCNKLSIKESKPPVYSINGNTSPSSWKSGTIVRDTSAKGYRLPTEAEWEYAARGGNQSHSYTYSGSNNLDSVGWYYGNSERTTHQVGTKAANELGIFDMSGNVFEWCWDWGVAYSSSAQTNPTGPSSGSWHLLRGGSWDLNSYYCRVSFRGSIYPGSNYNVIGFRVVEDF